MSGESNGYLNAAALRTPIPRRFADVAIPELNGKVRIRSLTARERGEYEAQFIDRKKGGNRLDRLTQARELLVIASVCDGQGNLILTREDVKALGAQDAVILDRIVEACRELSGISDDDFQALVGNSEPTAGAA